MELRWITWAWLGLGLSIGASTTWQKPGGNDWMGRKGEVGWTDRAPSGAVRLWATTDAAADLLEQGSDLWAATSGGLVHCVDGRVIEEIRQPAIAWRAVATAAGDVAAVGAQHVAWRRRGLWHSAPLRIGTEGYALAADGGGWWVGTSAGVSRLDPDAGLVASRDIGPVRRLVSDGQEVWALGSGRFFHLPEGEAPPPPGARGPWFGCIRGGRLVVAGTGGDQPLAVWEWSGKWARLPAIPGSGSHVTALAAGQDGLLAAVARDGLWLAGRRGWARIPGVPVPLSRDTAALRATAGGWLAAARSGGVWRWTRRNWERLPLGGDLPAANIQAMIGYRGVTYASTFDRGLLCLVGERWMSVAGSPAFPRQMATAGGLLFVRETDGTLASFDGRHWKRNLLRFQVRRSWIGGLCATPVGLALGGCGVIITGLPGAWKETLLPEPWDRVTASCVSWTGREVALGTGKDGLLLVNPETGGARISTGGPADTWVTALREREGEMVVGTAGGRIAGVRKGSREAVLGAPVTGLAALGPGLEIAATRDGLYRREGDDWLRAACPQADALEPQCLLATPEALWVGGRHGILRISHGRTQTPP